MPESNAWSAGITYCPPLLTTMLAQSWCQTERASPPDNRPPLHPSISPPTWTLWRWRLWSEHTSGKEGGRNTETEAAKSIAWWETENFVSKFCNHRWGQGRKHDAVAAHFSLRLLDRVTDYAYRPQNCSTCGVGQLIKATPSKTHPWNGWHSAE